MARQRNVTQEQLLELSAGFYDVLLGETNWQNVLEESVQIVSAGTLHLGFMDRQKGEVTNLGVVGPQPQSVIDAYTNHYAHIDPRVRSIISEESGSLVRCHDLFDAHYVKKNEVYQDYLIPNGLRYTMLGMCAKDRALSAMFGVMRPTDMGQYDEKETTVFKFILNHLGRVIQMQWRLQGLQRQLFAQEQALNSLSFGILVVNPQGFIHHANHEAEQLLRQLSALSVSKGRLRCAGSADQGHLDRALQSCIKLGIGTGLRLIDKATKQAWHLWLVPARDGLGFARASLAVVVINNPWQPPSLDTLLQRVFGFTAAELRMVSALLAGHTVAEHAERECISIATARTHVRAILGKAGVKRQTDLMRLLASSSLLVMKGTR